MKFETTLLQTGTYRLLQSFSFVQTADMNYDVISVPLEDYIRVAPGHPHIKRVVQIEIGQQRADHTALCKESNYAK